MKVCVVCNEGIPSGGRIALNRDIGRLNLSNLYRAQPVESFILQAGSLHPLEVSIIQPLFNSFSDFLADDNKKKLKRPTAKDITNWHRRKRCLIDSLRTGNEEITYTSKKVKRIPRTASSSDQKIPEFSYIKVPPNVLKLRTPPWPDVLKGIRALEEDIPGRKTPPEWEERESVDLEGSKEKVEEQGEEEEDALEKDEDVEDAIQEEVKEEKVVEEEEEELQEVGDEDEEMTVYNSATEIQRVVQMMGGVPPIPEARPKIDLAKTLPPLLRRELPVQVHLNYYNVTMKHIINIINITGICLRAKRHFRKTVADRLETRFANLIYVLWNFDAPTRPLIVTVTL